MATLEKAIPIASTFIKKWEGKPKTNKAGDFIAFNDGYDNPTIGSGITYYPDGSKVKYGDIITPAKGEQYFQWQIQEKTNGITDLIDIDKFTDNQVAALISFAYTTGVPGLAKSKLLKAILAGTRGNELRALWIVSYITSNGEHSNGLVNRRKDEFTLFNDTYSEVYSYYLRNEETIKTTSLFIAGGIAVAMSVYIYFITKNKK